MNMPTLSGPGPQKDDGWSAKGFIRFGLVCVLVLGGGFGTWAATATLAGAIIAMGQLRVETNRQVVQHLDGGIVGNIMARDGDTVEAGDVLVSLNATQMQAELTAIESQYFEIMSRLARLQAVQTGTDTIEFDAELTEIAQTNSDVMALIEGQRALFLAQRESMAKEMLILDQQKVQLREQIAGANAELASLRVQSEKIEEELVGARDLLSRGNIRKSQVLALEREAARLDGQTGQLRQQIPQLESRISEIDLQQIRLEDTMREESIAESRELGFRRTEQRERRAALRERLSRLEIRAPRSGVVIDSTVHALGAVIRPAEPIMYIIPNDTGLVVDARVEPISVDQIYVGQPAVLRFSAFNARTTPEISGAIKTVSPDVITDEQSGLSFYRAEVTIDENELPKLEGQALIPGMPVEVYVQTGERTPLAYLMKPLTDYFNRAWREE